MVFHSLPGPHSHDKYWWVHLNAYTCYLCIPKADKLLLISCYKAHEVLNHNTCFFKL